MTMPRSSLISLPDTPWYHIVSRCVRRAFLCGEDRITGQNFEHRRGWIESRIQELAAIFAIDVAAYAVMSNHYHIVVRVDVERPQSWSPEEVLSRWSRLFTGPPLIQRYLSSERDEMSPELQNQVLDLVETYRERLYDLSWFMRVLNETIARRANAEDNCKGRFWEGRFKSQALLDDQALLSAMAYVDLNPIRAGLAETPEQCDFTSVKRRVRDLSADSMPSTKPASALQQGPSITSRARCRFDILRPDSQLQDLTTAPLMPFDPSQSVATAVPFAFADYLELVNYIGRALHPNKSGCIPDKTPALLERLEISLDGFIQHADHLLQEFSYAVGTPENLHHLASSRQHQYLRGISAAREMFECRGTADVA